MLNWYGEAELVERCRTKQLWSSLLGGVIGVALAGWALAELALALNHYLSIPPEIVELVSPLRPYWGAGVATALLFVGRAACLAEENRIGRLQLQMGAGFLVIVLILTTGLTVKNGLKGFSALADQVGKRLNSDRKVGILREPLEEHFDPFVFYLGRSISYLDRIAVPKSSEELAINSDEEVAKLSGSSIVKQYRSVLGEGVEKFGCLVFKADPTTSRELSQLGLTQQWLLNGFDELRLVVNSATDNSGALATEAGSLAQQLQQLPQRLKIQPIVLACR
jgi:hypothetical protein